MQLYQQIKVMRSLDPVDSSAMTRKKAGKIGQALKPRQHGDQTPAGELQQAMHLDGSLFPRKKNPRQAWLQTLGAEQVTNSSGNGDLCCAFQKCPIGRPCATCAGKRQVDDFFERMLPICVLNRCVNKRKRVVAKLLDSRQFQGVWASPLRKRRVQGLFH